jgi:LacI family sucrose operon transcriptional repressor
MTIKEIARLAGVSPAMVSRYFNNGYVSEEKRELIAKVVKETGYKPSVQARNLRRGKANLIGVVVPRISSESVARMTSGIEEAIRTRGYQMLLANTENNADIELDYLALFERYPVDGIVLVGTMETPRHRKFIKETKTPFVIIGQRMEGASCIYHDDRGAARELGRKIAEHRPECVAYIGVTPEDRAVGVERRDGLFEGLAEGGSPVRDDLIRDGAFSTEKAHEEAKALLDAHPEIDCICCATDIMAAGAIEAANEVLGYGNDVIVSGFGDNHLVQSITGGIPTVHLGYRTSGRQGAEMLISQVENPGGMASMVELGYRVANI